MAGRIVPPFTFSGGMTEIEIGGATGRAPKNKLFRASHLGTPGGVMIQLRAEPIASTSDVARPIADVSWQVGSGIQEATVDIGNGCTFIVSAAEVVDVSVRMNDEYRVLSTGAINPWTSTIPYRCFGTAAPAGAMSSLPARFSNTVDILDAGAGSGAVRVPKWAKYLYIDQGATSEVTQSYTGMLLNTTILWGRNEAGTSTFGGTRWSLNVPIPVPDWARSVKFSTPAGANIGDTLGAGGGTSDVPISLTWILEL